MLLLVQPLRALCLLILQPPGLPGACQPTRHLPRDDRHVPHAALHAALPRPRHHQRDGRPEEQAEGDARPEEHDATDEGEDLQDGDGQEEEHRRGDDVGRRGEDGGEAVERGREQWGEDGEEVGEGGAEGLERPGRGEQRGLEVREVEEGFGGEDVWFEGGARLVSLVLLRFLPRGLGVWGRGWNGDGKYLLGGKASRVIDPPLFFYFMLDTL